MRAPFWASSDHALLPLAAEADRPPCANGMSIWSRSNLKVMVSKAASLKTLQFWYTSTNAAPRWSWARRNVSTMWRRSMSWVRATKVASAPEGQADIGLNGVVERAERASTW